MRRRYRAKTRCANPCEIPRARRRLRAGARPCVSRRGPTRMRLEPLAYSSLSIRIRPTDEHRVALLCPGDVAPRSNMRINRRPIRERAVTPGMPRDGLDRRAHRPGSCSREARETQLPHGRAHLLRGRARARRARIPRRPLHAIGRPLAEGTSRARARSHRAMRVVCASTTARMHEAHGCATARTLMDGSTDAHARASASSLRDQARTGRHARASASRMGAHRCLARPMGRREISFAAYARDGARARMRSAGRVPPYTRPAERMRAHGGPDLMRVRRRSREAGDGLRP